MPAIINGIVYDDRNQNGQYDVGEPGIPGVFVLLYTPSGSCSATQSDSNGSYGFSVTAPGAYTVCETALPPNACPPTVVAQPAGYAHSTAPAHGPPRSLPPKSNATRSLPGKISGMTQWMPPALHRSNDPVCQPPHQLV